MKIKRFFAPDIRNAMKMVKEELGSDAVIMSNRSVDGGVEIVAARDFDERVIHNKLKKQGPGESASEQKKSDAPDFAGAGKPLHIVSSSRKKGVDGSIPKNPIRRNLDQYLGYAEKIQLASSSRKGDKPGEISRQATSQQATIKPAVTSQPTISIEQLMQEMRNEMRQELDSLRSALDGKLAQLNEAGQQIPAPVETHMDLLERLLELGVCKKLSLKIANRLSSHRDSALAFAKALDMLGQMLPIAADDLLENGGIAALVGPTGVGKTTTIAKIAAQFILRHGQRDVALITTDNYRIGAHEQLNIYGRILDVPVRVANNAEELSEHIDDFRDKRLILIDTAGMSQRDLRLADQIKTLRQNDLSIKTYLVTSAATQYRAMNEIIEAFRSYEPQAGIMTKTDEAVTQGSALSAFIEHQLPLSFLTDGQQVPEDIHLADAETLIKQCVAGIVEENGYTKELSDEEWAEGYA